MADTPPPLLEGARLAWLLALVSGAAAALWAVLGHARPGLAALAHVALLSTAAYALFAWDKRRARREARRISEANLLWLAALGGAAGAWLAMARHRHKTRRARFRLLVPAALLLHALAVAWVAARS